MPITKIRTESKDLIGIRLLSINKVFGLANNSKGEMFVGEKRNQKEEYLSMYLVVRFNFTLNQYSCLTSMLTRVV